MDRFPAVDSAALSCWDREVFVVYKALVDAHRANQRAVLAGDSHYASGCPELTGLQPDHGPRAGGYRVAVTGRNLLPPTLELYWGEFGVDAEARRESDGTMTVLVPNGEGAKTYPSITLRISEAPRLDAPLYAELRYDD